MPKPDKLHALEWIGVEFLTQGVINTITDGGLAFVLSSIAPWLISVDNLCASNPQVPEAFTDDDFIHKLEDVLSSAFPGAPFMSKLVEWVQYGAFLNFCDCPGSEAPPPFTPTGSCNNLQQTTCTPHGMGWDSASLGKLCTGQCSYVVNLDWVFSQQPNARVFVWPFSDQPPNYHPACVPTESFVQELHGTWTAVNGGCGAGYEFTPGQYGPYLSTTSSICSLQSPDVFSQDIQIMVSIPSDTGPGSTNRWGFSAHASMICTEAPVQPPPPTTTFPPAPARPCDSATVCDITWLINNFLTNQYQVTTNSNTQVTNITIGAAPVVALPPTYQPGSSWSISGSGEQAVAAGTLALSVVITGNPPPLDPIPTDPPDFYNVGNIITGDDEGWDIRRWVRRSPMRIFPTRTPMTRFAWNLADGVTMTVTELV